MARKPVERSMNSNHPFHFLLPLAGAVALALFGCSSKPKDSKADCEPNFQKLHAKFEKGKYAYAKEGYDEFIISCAGTEFAEQAYFELAESHFALKEWLEAGEEYQGFLKEYPSSKRYDETARYKMALSLSEQVEIPQRDQTKTLDAIRQFESYLALYPDSPRADTAKTKLDELHQLLVQKDLRIARLYTRMDEPLAAATYYKHILKEYGDRVSRRDIILKLSECYIELEQFVEAENQLSQFDGIAKDDPFREQVKTMQGKLEKARARYAREKQEEKNEAEKKQAEEKSKAL